MRFIAKLLYITEITTVDKKKHTSMKFSQSEKAKKKMEQLIWSYDGCDFIDGKDYVYAMHDNYIGAIQVPIFSIKLFKEDEFIEEFKTETDLTEFLKSVNVDATKKYHFLSL